MDKKLFKEAMKKKLESEYMQGVISHGIIKLDAVVSRQAREAYAMILLLDSCENPLLAVVLAEKMNICPSGLSDDSFWNDIFSTCCTTDEIQSMKVIRYLVIYSHMTEQERADWWEEAVGLLEKWDKSKKGNNE